MSVSAFLEQTLTFPTRYFYWTTREQGICRHPLNSWGRSVVRSACQIMVFRPQHPMRWVMEKQTQIPVRSSLSLLHFRVPNTHSCPGSSEPALTRLPCCVHHPFQDIHIKRSQSKNKIRSHHRSVTGEGMRRISGEIILDKGFVRLS